MTPNEELEYLEGLSRTYINAIWEAAHVLGMGTPTSDCSIPDVIDRVFDRIDELRQASKG